MPNFPFAPADKYAFPGGYPIGYVCDDGELLCADCMNDPTNPIHSGGAPDGWRIDGMTVLEDSDSDDSCAHCYRPFFQRDSLPTISL
jgi:hypothetical protein